MNKETSFYTCHRASFTVEAIVVIPLFAFCLLSVLYFFRILQVQAVVEKALLDAGRQVAVESCVVEDASALLLSAEGFLLANLREEDLVRRHVNGGAFGVVLLQSSFEGEEIILRARYYVSFPMHAFGRRGILLYSNRTFRKWNHAETKNWVYITETGTVYHRSKECRTINLKIQSTKMAQIDQLRGENGQRYFPCFRCTEDLSPHVKVYYTAYGELYHGSLNCSAIKRTVTRVLAEEVKDRRPCSVCGE